MKELREILFLAHRIPYPPIKGDKIRSWNFFSHLTERYEVYLGCFVDDHDDLPYVHELGKRCADCYVVNLQPWMARLRCIRGILDDAPLTVPYYRDAGLNAWVKQVLNHRKPDCIFVYSAAMAQYVMGEKYQSAHRVIDFVDVDSDKWRQFAADSAWPRSWIYQRESRKLLEFERKIAAAFNASLFVSSAEADFFSQLVPEYKHKIFRVNNAVDSEYFSPEKIFDNPYERKTNILVFTGVMNYRPNVDAAIWLAHEVLPRVRKHVPDALFAIVGAAPARAVRNLGRLPGVTVTGPVRDVRPYLAHAALVVAPLRMSRGIQNKVLEGMAMAKTVVATPQALEGITAEIGREVLVASDKNSFADTIVTMLGSGEREAIGKCARKRVIADHAWPASLERLEMIINGQWPVN